MPRLDQAQLNVVDTQRLLGALVEALQHLRSLLASSAPHGEALTTPGNRHIQRSLDLPQVLVERAAEVGEP